LRSEKLSEQPALGIEKSVCPDHKYTGSQLGEAGERGFDLRFCGRVQHMELQSKMDRSSRSRACNAFEQTRCLGGYLSLATIEIQVAPAAQGFLSTKS
jgi:hypothetical protein